MEPILGDGRPLLLVVAGSLVFSGGFALFLAATGEFLPHDIHNLGMSSADLCGIASCRIVDFMVHDRAAFGGTLMGCEGASARRRAGVARGPASNEGGEGHRHDPRGGVPCLAAFALWFSMTFEF